MESVPVALKRIMVQFFQLSSCIYMNDLYKKLREKKSRCWINGDFVGIAGYADDNFLMSPTLDGLQEMLDTCEEYANEHNLTFSTNW